MMIVMIRMRIVMITIIVASSALPMGPNVTFEMHIRIRIRMRRVVVMMMMRRAIIIIRMIMMMIMMITIIVTPFASPVLPNKRW